MKSPLLLLSLFTVTLTLGVGPAAADEAAAPAPSPAVEGQAVTEPAPASPAPEGHEPVFVDRDGDGLQDGQEHRFRGRWRGLGGKGGLGEGRMERRGAGGNGPHGGETGGGRQKRGNP